MRNEGDVWDTYGGKIVGRQQSAVGSQQLEFVNW
jgi:hypothetical protein